MPANHKFFSIHSASQVFKKIISVLQKIPSMEKMEINYVIPSDCPDHELISGAPAWGFPDAISQELFETLLKSKISGDIRMFGVHWTCAGCSKSMGEPHCEKRRCTVGGELVE